ncbi:glycosyltransferase family 2 protein [bacterium]|jgi:glycosyltransferase involved in cell wall biosynthesis|nr:glycosyltransferase family 2 protein [bacterium]MBT4121967.1 glycosyltransferase family 2 protein [bacterium]MBT4335434.1 glycosyltransferase family 2 protein [bacterium]MBT4495525.1 glycosyltransferase family 2 protein [bacterium]MBT4764183.1 glycosyltransferase family 2 protein [bacterium]
MPKVSVIIPTFNRPELIKDSVLSVLNQTYTDLEVIVVDDGVDIRAESVINEIDDKRVKYVQHEVNKGGGAARNTGLKHARGEYIAFLDDDDAWFENKLEIQMKEFEKTGRDVGFCFCAVECDYGNNNKKNTSVSEGVADYHELVLRRFKGFLTVTLIIKKYVFDEVGNFDINFVSHQEPDLMIRVTRKFKGLGVNKPLVYLNMKEGHDHIGSNIVKKISGRKMIIEKYIDEYNTIPKILAKHYFQLALFYRENKDYLNARTYFKKAWFKNIFKLRYILHYLIIINK